MTTATREQKNDRNQVYDYKPTFDLVSKTRKQFCYSSVLDSQRMWRENHYFGPLIVKLVHEINEIKAKSLKPMIISAYLAHN